MYYQDYDVALKNKAAAMLALAASDEGDPDYHKIERAYAAACAACANAYSKLEKYQLQKKLNN